MRGLMLAFLALLSLAVPALAQDDYRHGRIRYLEPGVTLQRATETGAEEAVVNLPFLPGDRVWTDANGFYAFGNLVAGDYVVQETQPAGYQQGWNNLGSLGGTTLGDTFGMRLEQATSAANYNFGEVVPQPVTPPNPPLVTPPPSDPGLGFGKAFFFGNIGTGFSW